VDYLASFLGVVEEALPDPRGPTYPPLMCQVVRVMTADGSVRMNSVQAPPRPFTIEELVRELVAGQDRLHGRTGRQVGGELRWRPFGQPV